MKFIIQKNNDVKDISGLELQKLLLTGLCNVNVIDKSRSFEVEFDLKNLSKPKHDFGVSDKELLLDRNTMTIKQMAEKYDCSERTIQRKIRELKMNNQCFIEKGRVSKRKSKFRIHSYKELL